MSTVEVEMAEIAENTVDEPETVTMTCLTTKQKFEVLNPTVVVLANGRFAYRVTCPWKGKNDKELTAFKFCGRKQYEAYEASLEASEDSE